MDNSLINCLEDLNAALHGLTKGTLVLCLVSLWYAKGVRNC